MAVEPSTQSLRQLVDAIVANDGALFSKLIKGSPALATASFSHGATRQGPSPSLSFKEIGHYIYSGDTALHFAAASYRHKMADKLIEAAAKVRAKNRRGAEPLHAAAFGSPGSPRRGSGSTSGDDRVPYTSRRRSERSEYGWGYSTAPRRSDPLRGAVRALLAHGANPAIRNKNGSTAMTLALFTTGTHRFRLTRGEVSATRDSAFARRALKKLNRYPWEPNATARVRDALV